MEERVPVSQPPWRRKAIRPAASDSHTPDTEDLTDLPTDAITNREFVAAYLEQVTPLYRYFLHQVGNVHDAEDLVATTASKALTSFNHFASARGSFGAWLFGIARHTLRDFQRRVRPTADVTLLDPPPTDPAPSLDTQILQNEAVHLLHHRVRQLPIGQREALMMRYFGALRTDEIATVLGRSEGAVKLLIHRALTTLRDQYRQEARQ